MIFALLIVINMTVFNIRHKDQSVTESAYHVKCCKYVHRSDLALGLLLKIKLRFATNHEHVHDYSHGEGQNHDQK